MSDQYTARVPSGVAGTQTGVVMKTSNLEDLNVVDILDRVLDKGIVIDPSARVSLMGQDLHAMRSRVVVESVMMAV